ncbi:MAG: hypothetical protein R2828_17645 [Saprospiraceae bacterium]
MKKLFSNRLEAIDWIAENAEDESQFEVLREQLNFNFIYTGQLFVEIGKEEGEVAWIGK